jgi:hypothetical protein
MGISEMVAKKEGATMTCNQCGIDLICRQKDYGGNFASTLQWQNYDETAHYKTTDGKNFECNVPDEDEAAQTRIPTDATKTAGDAPPGTITKAEFQILAHLEEKVETLNLQLEKMDEMVQAIFRYTVDEQLKKK